MSVRVRDNTKGRSRSRAGWPASTRDVVPPRGNGWSLGIQARLFLWQAGVVTLLTLVLAATLTLVLERSTREEFGERALAISRIVAAMPEVVGAIATSAAPSSTIDPLANRIRRRVGADFIVVGDVHGIRLSHPQPEKIGRSMMEGSEPASDTLEPLAGREIITVALGGLGLSVRGKVPIRDANGRVIGLVSTGYLLPTVQTTVARVSRTLWPWFGLALGLALSSSIVISRRFKRELLELEPDEIAALVLQHRAVLSALQEGVIVLDAGGKILILNPRAAEMLRLEPQTILPAPIRETWPELAASGLLEGDSNAINQALSASGMPVLVRVLRASEDRRVVTFRDRAEVTRIAEELTQTREYADLLRAQTHEFMNRLHTIAGLIQLGRPLDALALIQHESAQKDAVREAISDIEVPKLAALVIGKLERARELGIPFSLEPGSGLSSAWDRLATDVLVPVVGNLLENAFDAALERPASAVTLTLGEDPDGAQIEVCDGGPGVRPAALGRIFERGFSTRGASRGLGLFLVRQRVESRGGTVVHLERDGLTVFQVSLPSSALADVDPR